MNRHLGYDGRSMVSAGRRVGVVMGVAPRRVLAAAPQRRPRPAATPAPPPARPAAADKAWVAAIAGLLRPKPDPWDALVRNLTGIRP